MKRVNGCQSLGRLLQPITDALQRSNDRRTSSSQTATPSAKRPGCPRRLTARDTLVQAPIFEQFASAWLPRSTDSLPSSDEFAASPPRRPHAPGCPGRLTARDTLVRPPPPSSHLLFGRFTPKHRRCGTHTKQCGTQDQANAERSKIKTIKQLQR